MDDLDRRINAALERNGLRARRVPADLERLDLERAKRSAREIRDAIERHRVKIGKQVIK